MRKRDMQLQVAILGETGEIIVQVFDTYTVLTVRQPAEERLAEVRLTGAQASALSEVLQRTPEEDEWEH